jgi:hypothetical protein
MASEQVPLNAFACPVPKKTPMFDRALFEVVLTSKSAVKLKVPCSMHWFVFGIPPWNTLTVVESTAAILTSPAEQLFALLTSPMQLPAANAGAARMTIASSARIKETFRQLVRQLITFLLLRRKLGFGHGCCL